MLCISVEDLFRMEILKDWLLENADGEPIEGVVIGSNWGTDNWPEKIPSYEDQPRDTVLSWEEALPWISYEFSSSWGAPKCNSVVAWTRSWVISVSQYDGSTCPFRIPRNPTSHKPEMPGG